jgi:hypothetical protein
MIEALLLAMAQPPMSAIDAERAFVADAQKLGQWTAFRKWAADDATMFLPQAGSAHDWLKDKADPPVAVFWWPGRSFVSCDGNTAVNTGPWVRGWGKSVGYFTTVWKRQADGGWKWALDHGDALKTSRAEGGDIASRRASCIGKPVKDRFVLTAAVGATIGEGVSNDGSLHWAWIVEPSGGRQVVVRIWNGNGFETVIHDRVAAE